METASKARLWTGRVLSAIGVLFLTMDGVMKAFHLLQIEEGNELLMGFHASTMPTIGWILLGCVALHLFPRTSVLGAILITGFLGGAVASQVRVGNPLFTHTLFPTYVAMFVWGGLVLRRPEIRLLLPSRRGAEKPAAQESALMRNPATH